MRVCASKLTPDSVVTYLFYDRRGLVALLVGRCLATCIGVRVVPQHYCAVALGKLLTCVPLSPCSMNWHRRKLRSKQPHRADANFFPRCDMLKRNATVSLKH